MKKEKIERWIVCSSGVKDGKSYSFARMIRENTKKDNGDENSGIIENSFQREDVQLPVGTILEYGRTLATPIYNTVDPFDDAPPVKKS